MKDDKTKDYSIVANTSDGVYYLYSGQDVIFATRKSEVAQMWIEKHGISVMMFE